MGLAFISYEIISLQIYKKYNKSRLNSHSGHLIKLLTMPQMTIDKIFNLDDKSVLCRQQTDYRACRANRIWDLPRECPLRQENARNPCLADQKGAQVAPNQKGLPTKMCRDGCSEIILYSFYFHKHPNDNNVTMS